MRLRIRAILLPFCLLLLCGDISLAQKERKVRADWIANDVANIERLLPQLKRAEPLTIAALERIFGMPAGDTELGFGGRTFRFSKSGGYTYLRVEGFVFNDSIGYYTISIAGSSWPKIRNVLLEALKRNSELEFEERESGVVHRRQFVDVVAAYKNAVAAQLGELAPVTIPPHLNDGYQLLVSLGESSVLGDVCGYGAVTPRGKLAIDTLVNAGRVDLISNVVKGYNPGGRVYAALALLAVARRGIDLPPDARRAIETIRTLDIDLQTCSGCELGFAKAKQVLNEWDSNSRF